MVIQAIYLKMFPLPNNIRILYGYEVRIENSVPRVTVWHHEAVPSDAIY